MGKAKGEGGRRDDTADALRQFRAILALLMPAVARASATTPRQATAQDRAREALDDADEALAGWLLARERQD